MTNLDSIKRPVELRFPASDNRLPASRPAADSEQRQTVTDSGNKLPEAAKASTAEQLSEIRDATKTIASFVQNVSRELRFSVDADLGKTVVTVVDQNTDQIIRQIPGEEALALARYLTEQSLAGVQGILVTEKA